MQGTSLRDLYGSAVFTTIRIVNGEPWLWDKHWGRLMHDAGRLGIDTSPYSEYMVRRGLDESIPDRDRAGLLKARITITDERPGRLWSDLLPQVAANVEFLVARLRPLPRPFVLGVSPHLVNSTSPIAGLKTCNYLEQIRSLSLGMSSGLNESVRLNERGHVTSACLANIFWLKDGRLFTPSLSTGCLPGTTREFVCEKMDVKEVETDIVKLKNADAIFLTSAGLGVIAVDEFDGREMPRRDHEILQIAVQSQLPRMHE